MKETILGEKMKQDYSSKICCNVCGFPVNLPREPVFITDSVFSLLSYEENTCKSCGHQKDGTTIPIIYQRIQELLRERVEERKNLIRFIKKYNHLSKEQRLEVCVMLPRFMKPNYKSKGDMEEDDLEEPYSWNVVMQEVEHDTKLSEAMLNNIDWTKIEKHGFEE